MKKYIIVFFALFIVAILYLNFSSSSKKGFVSLKNNEFILNDKAFFPIVINYCAAFQTDKKNLWVRPSKFYSIDNFEYTNKDSCLIKFKSDMDLIKKMGFNSVRICKVGETRLNEEKEGELSFKVHIANQNDSTFILTNNDKNYTSYFSALDEMLNIINNAGLKVIFLTKTSPKSKTTETHLAKLCKRFKDNSTIFAYDLFNEPLYFDKPIRKKEEVFQLMIRWDKIIEKNAPHHLSTIGLEGIREVFEWDPNILNVDFISYHPYEYEYEQVRNEIYWYGKYTKKPWIIGETAIPADNDSVPYKEQLFFAEKTMKQNINCGGSGYSWWQFKDIEGNEFHSSFMGVITQKEKIKPITEAFIKFSTSTANKDSCLCLDNYYNYSQSQTFKIIGKLVDNNNKAIEGGVILGWNQWWTHSYHTITKADGSFELLGSYPFYHWMASATEHSRIRGELNPDSAKIDKENMPTIDLRVLKLEKLSFLENY